MLDHGSYDAMSVIAPGHAALQGPALVLASSRALDDNDLLRIKQIGSSEKCKQFAQAGRFGLGLNSLYHLSDTPQIFAANLAFVVLDPLHKLGDEDGKKFLPAQLRENFPNMLAPFEAVPKEYPTVFRLPLRTSGPSSFGKKWSAQDAFDLLSRFIELQKSELLLFSRSVTQVVVDVRSSDGTVARLREIARTDTVDDDDDTPLQSPRKSPRKSPRVAKRTAVAATSQAPVYVSSPFMQRLPTTLEEVRQLQQSPRDSIERVTIVIESPDAAPVKERWLIAHSLAVDGDGLGLIRDFMEASTPTALLPHGAVALLLGGASEYKGNVAAYMPIGLSLGSPMVLHGCFAMDDSRKNVPLPDGKQRMNQQQGRWNQALLRCACARAFRMIVTQCCELVSERTMRLSEYFDLLSLADDDSNKQSAMLREATRAALWQELSRSDANRVLPVASPKDEKVREWLPVRPTTLLRADPKHLQDVQDKLIADGMKLCLLPDDLLRQMLAADSPLVPRHLLPQHVSPRVLCDFLKEEQRRVRPDKLRSLGSIALVSALLRFVLPEPVVPKEKDAASPPVDLGILEGVPLLVLNDESIVEFGDATCFWNDAAPLLPVALGSLIDVSTTCPRHVP